VLPENFLTPSLCPGESFPFLVDPPDFLVAHLFCNGDNKPATVKRERDEIRRDHKDKVQVV